MLFEMLKNTKDGFLNSDAVILMFLTFDFDNRMLRVELEANPSQPIEELSNTLD